MKSPTLFKILQIPLSFVVDANYKLAMTDEEMKIWYVRQGDCMLFSQIRRITGAEWQKDRVITEMVFCDLANLMRDKAIATEIVKNGFVLNGRQYYCCERSASMKQ